MKFIEQVLTEFIEKPKLMSYRGDWVGTSTCRHLESLSTEVIVTIIQFFLPLERWTRRQVGDNGLS